MDFRFSPEEKAFRQETGDFIHKEVPPDYGGPISILHPSASDEEEFSLRFNKRQAEKGWLRRAWPTWRAGYRAGT